MELKLILPDGFPLEKAYFFNEIYTDKEGIHFLGVEVPNSKIGNGSDGNEYSRHFSMGDYNHKTQLCVVAAEIIRNIYAGRPFGFGTVHSPKYGPQLYEISYNGIAPKVKFNSITITTVR